jgi:hypothetical protein
MSQFNLTPEENALVVDAVRSKANQYTAVYGVADPVLEALVAKMSPVEAVVVEEAAPVVEEAAPVVEDAALAAFLDDVPHEQFTHKED